MTDTPAQPRPARRRFALSVRALMAVVLLLAVALGWVVNRARAQREAVTAIERTGGGVVYEWGRVPGKGLDPKAAPPWPGWMISLLGVDSFGHVISAHLGDRATDAEMAHLGRLPRLERAYVVGPGVTDAGVAHLRGLRRLTHVYLDRTRTTRASLAEIGRLPNLTKLYLVGLDVGDADLIHLVGLRKLEQVGLSSNPITDAGLAHLAGLDRLRHLDLDGTAVTGAGVARLAHPGINIVFQDSPLGPNPAPSNTPPPR